ncbi:MAPEG family protein [Albidovulum sediminicola]|uniref:MAPEG family protein n=1 Tax=Albidovulum sediminicola TaxID=2984331 RepID=A0ABT2Z2L4_9RHOB|nr:MAPEG family protein [Defluviimonas sp. WL0075]MCV2865338.1 MAPEG family protein [Defluviimonas sp. WL0075]
MSNELTILALYGLFVCLLVFLKVTGAMGQLGIGYLMSARDEKRELKGITARLDRALANSTTAMMLFAPAILVLGQLGAFSSSTLVAAQIFLIARVLYVPAYALGLTGLRTAIWLAGFAATIVLYLIALMAA